MEMNASTEMQVTDVIIQQLSAKIDARLQQLTSTNLTIHQQLNHDYNILDSRIQELNNTVTQLLLAGQNPVPPSTSVPPSTQVGSCSALPANSPSGYYMIVPPTGPPAVQVYCEFNRQCGCGQASTWTRVAFLNMSDPNEVCPTNWELYTTPTRACGNGPAGSIEPGSCDSVIYPTMGQTYSRVCGRTIAYQYQDTTAFSRLLEGHTIDQPYLDGVSITHGSAGSRQHIWSFASAFGDAFVVQQPGSNCDCSSSNPWSFSTSFVGNDYFCDTALHTSSYQSILYADDPLWDGAGCGADSTCCTFNNPPWFCKTLPQPTTDDLEVRICDSLARRDTPIELMEIFVQ